MDEETRVIPLWRLKDIANTLRMVSNVWNSPKRETCLDRNIMRDWNIVVDLIKENDVSVRESCGYYTKIGQIPDSNY